MQCQARSLVAILVSFALMLGIGSTASAQEATPIATADVGVVASGLDSPRGVTWDAKGNLYVAIAGTGNAGTGKTSDGESGSLARIVDGCPVTVATGLPSTRGMDGAAQGPSAVAVLDGQLYVLQDGSYSASASAPKPNGVYAVEPDGTFRLVADISAWVAAHPVAAIPYDFTPAGETFNMIAGDGVLWVAESNSGQLLRVTPKGAISRVADLSAGHLVPTGLALAPGGGVYVGFLTPAPYTGGASKVIKIAADGTRTDAWTGLTAITALAVDPAGTLYALELATGNLDQAPYLQPRTGKVVRQTGKAASAAVATGLDYPVAMAFGPDAALYVSLPALASDHPGGILRLDPSAPAPVAVDPSILNQSPCATPATPAPPAPQSWGETKGGVHPPGLGGRGGRTGYFPFVWT
ncbi:MAG TPA: ScyD/ScyE family protein [Thermomicrobiales bacterium]